MTDYGNTEFVQKATGKCPTTKNKVSQASVADGSVAEAEFKAAKTRLEHKGIAFMDGFDFLAKEPTHPKWIVKDFVAVGMKGDLIGSAKTKKTFLALNFALCVAAGKNLLDVMEMEEPHKVAYLNLELFDWNFHERMKAECTKKTYRDGHAVGGLGVEPEALKGRFFPFNLRGCASGVREMVGDLIVVFRHLGIELVVIDPRYKLLHADEDENTGTGLQGVLAFRDTLAEHFAVMIVTHDAKGDTSQKKMTDRGAGSYRAGADYDFRIVIDRSDDWSEDDQRYVVGFDGRARKPPSQVGAKFDEEGKSFHTGDGYSTAKMNDRAKTRTKAETRAAEESAWQNAYREAALKVVADAKDHLLCVEQFDARLKAMPTVKRGINAMSDQRKVLVCDGTLAVVAELERKADGSVRNVKNGRTFISTPDRIEAYRRGFERLDL